MTAPIHVTNRPLDYVEMAGRAALALKTRRDQLRVVDGSRRMLGPKSPRPPLDLKIIKGEDQPCQ